MLRIILQTHIFYKHYDSHVDWIRESTQRVKKAMAEYGIQAWTTLQCARKWQWALKMVQSTGPRWTREVNEWQPIDIRTRGRPKTRWADDINEYLTHAFNQKSIENGWSNIAANSEIWKSLAAGFICMADLSSDDNEDNM